MENNQNATDLSINMQKVKNVLDEKKFSYEVTKNNEIILGINEKEFFVDVLIKEDADLDRIIILAKQRNLAFSKDIVPAVKDIISDINDEIPYGHIVMEIIEEFGFALFKSFISPENITRNEVEYNLMACVILIKRYFDEFAHFGVNS